MDMDTSTDRQPDHDETSWVWDEQNRKSWSDAPLIWQQLYQRWYTDTTTEQDAPYVLHLLPGHVKKGFGWIQSTNNVLLVRKSYQDLFERIHKYAIGSAPSMSSALVTGQPGTGKSVFLWYSLVSLLRRKYVVAYTKGSRCYLFFFGRVYKAPVQDLDTLPVPGESAACGFLWTLIDMDTRAEPPTELTVANDGPRVFPFQVTSPNPVRYKDWRKQRGGDGLFLGMPLWDQKELTEGFKLQVQYTQFCATFKHVAKLDDISGSVAHNEFFSAANTALQRLREADIDPPKYTLEENVDNIIGTAMESWGNDPRSVYLGILNPVAASKTFASALRGVSYESLLSLVRDFDEHGAFESSLSHALIKITPHRHERYEDFSMDFKSSFIGQAVMNTMQMKENDRIGELYRLFKGPPQTSSIAGWCFETIAHNALAARKTPLEALRKMHKDDTNANSPCFKTNAALSPAEPPSIPTPQMAASYNFVHRKYDLDVGTYYASQSHNNPLFDAVLLEVTEKNVVRVWLFQMTISTSHGGADTGYVRIRKAVSAAKRHADLLPGSNKIVEVVYVLVHPQQQQEAAERTWTMPQGWEEKTSRDDHRGDVYCLGIPL